MWLHSFFKRFIFTLMHYYQQIQHILLTVFVIGVVDYFFLYEISVYLFATMPMLAVELIPLGVLLVLAIIVWRAAKYVRRKMKDNKHYLMV
ncbi:hypothetical protein ACFPVX_03640 [Cohnella faecalis]|uniref:Uncharacterized protein n=1 Tax=Cohnella faecalis TaxID=2315694 RepID=A0A398CRI0_9BACL|nr:hypothetical protein [Cohnella faecalis]RIE03388.1 hypothetical protein D3H35_11980 [Cohnella faecalis]